MRSDCDVVSSILFIAALFSIVVGARVTVFFNDFTSTPLDIHTTRCMATSVGSTKLYMLLITRRRGRRCRAIDGQATRCGHNFTRLIFPPLLRLQQPLRWLQAHR